MALSPPLVPGAVAAAIRPRGYLFFAPTLSIRLTRESGPAGTLMLSDHRPELGRGSPCFSRGAHMLLRLIGLEGLNYASKQYCPVNLKGVGQKANSGAAFRVTRRVSDLNGK
jgi:hypothetical protein